MTLRVKSNSNFVTITHIMINIFRLLNFHEQIPALILSKHMRKVH